MNLFDKKIIQIMPERVEGVKTHEKWPLVRQPESSLPPLIRGQSVMMQVISRTGENIVLKNESGRLIEAKIPLDMITSEGDNIELIVRDRSEDHLVLQMISAEPSKKDIPLQPSLLETIGLQDNANASEILQVFQDIQIKPTAELISASLKFIQDDPELDVRSAAFFTANSIPVTHELKEAYMALTKGENLMGDWLVSILKELPTPSDAKQAVMPEETNRNGRTISQFIRLLFWAPEEGQNGQTMKNIRNTLPEKLLLLKNIIQNADIRSKESILQKAGQLECQSMLTARMKYPVYAQIPLRLREEYGTAEFFVYKRKKHNGKAETTTILVGLTMRNMGRTEALLRMEGKNLTIVFKLEKEEYMPMVKERSLKLYKELSRLGYHLTSTQVQQLTEHTTIANAQEVLSIASNKTQAFLDCRI